MTLRMQLLSETATAPVKPREGDVGYDLHADFGGPGNFISISPGGRYVVTTNVAVAVPPGTYGRVAPRSGLAVKSGINVLAGVIDPSYRAGIGVVIHNTSREVVRFHHADRVAQLVLEKCATPEVEVVAELEATERGFGAYGSTGR